MKIIIALTFAAMVSLIYSDEDAASQPDRSRRSSMMDRMPLSFGKRIPIRSLRTILDRMSAGYGKRNTDIPSARGLLTVDDMASIILSDPHLAQRFVQMYIDVDRNGLISDDELYSGNPQ